MKAKHFHAAFLLLFCTTGLWATENTNINGIWYDLDSNSKTATVTQAPGYNREPHSKTYKGNVIIPDYVKPQYGLQINYRVTKIGEYAFGGCTDMISITIPNTVTCIEVWAFYNCSGLTSVTIPESVNSIGGSAFSNCSGLTSVTIPESVNSIGDGAFNSCGNLPIIENLRYADTYLIEAVDKNLTSYAINDGTKWVNAETFYNCKNMVSVIIPNSVIHIGKSCFYGCKKLASMSIPNNVERINDFTFYDCRNLSSISLGNLITSIGKQAFYNCKSLTTITIPDSVTSIGDYAFQDCKNIVSATFGKNVTNIGRYTFTGCNKLVNVVWKAKNCADFSSEDTPFYALVGEYRYDLHGQITSFVFGDEVNYIPAYLCHRMNQLTSISIPNSVTSIGEYAFYRCSSLTSITFPDNVTSIKAYAFKDCTGLTAITSEAITPPRYGSWETQYTFLDPFTNVNKSIPLYVPASSVEDYKTASCWKEFMNIQPISTSTDYISIRPNSHKLIKGGQLLILRDGKTYTIQGVEVR